MNLNENELTRKEEEIYRLIEKSADKIADRFPIYDGINNIEQYANATYRILFVLKEPYDEKEGKGGNWKIKDILGKGGYGRASKSFYPMIYITYGILNNFMSWGEMDYVQDNFEEMNSYLYRVAHINISKLPSINGTRTDFSHITEAYKKDRENDNIILKQITAYNPHFIVGCGIENLLMDDLELCQIEKTNGYTSRKFPDLLYIGAYHPAQTTCSQEEYCNSVINIAKDWVKRN
jgi:hypothetical protein